MAPPAVSARPIRKPSWSTGYTSAIAARPAVHTRPAAAPCMKRARARSSGPVARAKPRVAARSTTAAIIITGRRPMRSTQPAAASAKSSWPTGKTAKMRAATEAEKS